MIVRVKLALEQPEYSALLKLAISEFRGPENQLHFILHKELKRRGLITEEIRASDHRTVIHGVDNGSK